MDKQHKLQQLSKLLKEVKGNVKSQLEELSSSSPTPCFSSVSLQHDSPMDVESVIFLRYDGLMMPPFSSEKDDDGLMMQLFA